MVQDFFAQSVWVCSQNLQGCVCVHMGGRYIAVENLRLALQVEWHRHVAELKKVRNQDETIGCPILDTVRICPDRVFALRCLQSWL